MRKSVRSRPAPPLWRFRDLRRVSATEVDHSFERPKLNLFLASILAGQPEAFAISEGEVRFGPLVETLRRTVDGSDADPGRRDLGHRAVVDQQRDAAEMDLTPAFGDAIKLVTRPARDFGLDAMAIGNESFQAAQGGLPVIVADAAWRAQRLQERSASASRRR
jgi:hypothetical protein